MNCCSTRCGHCGRCDDGLREGENPWLVEQCDICHTLLDSFTGRVTIANMGQFCSRTCADVGVSRHEVATMRRRSA